MRPSSIRIWCFKVLSFCINSMVNIPLLQYPNTDMSVVDTCVLMGAYVAHQVYMRHDHSVNE